MNQKNNKNIKYLLGFFVIVVLIIIVIVYSNRSVNINTILNLNNTNNSNLNNTIIINTESFNFSGGEYILDVEYYSDQSQRLKVRNLADGTIKEIGLSTIEGYTLPERSFSDFIWNEDKTRIYFISKRVDWDYITLLYLDSSDVEPYYITEIVYTDVNNILNSSIELISIENNILKFLSDKNYYLLDSSLGPDAKPVIVEDS